MKIFFDTEFANLGARIDSKRNLISIGLVAENGREFYAELTDTWDDSQCSMFVFEHVLPLLQGGECAMSVAELATRLKAWLEDFGKEITLFSDNPTYDWPFIEEIFDHFGWPANLRKKCSQIGFSHNTHIHQYQAATANFWRDNEGKNHHALYDARCMKFASAFAIRKGRPQ